MKKCNIFNHANNLEFICMNPTCSAQRIFCKTCEYEYHSGCSNYIIEIKDALERNLKSSAKIIPGEAINEALDLIKTHNLTTDRQIAEIFESGISKEFDSLRKYLTQCLEQKIQETKEKVFGNFCNLYQRSQFSLDVFKHELGELFNFDRLMDVLGPLFHDKCDISTTSDKLASFFNRIHTQKAKIADMADMASQLVFFTKDLLKFDQKPFLEARESFVFKMFDNYPLPEKTWSWDPSKSSSGLILNENKLQVIKNADSFFSYSAALGSKLFSEGFHQWEIDVNSTYPGSSLISFGIVKADSVYNSESFPFHEAMSVSTDGTCGNMNQVRLLNEYDNKKYLCSLDMKRGTFTIIRAQEGVIAMQTNGIKGNMILPFVSLCYPGNTAKVRVITSIN